MTEKSVEQGFAWSVGVLLLIAVIYCMFCVGMRIYDNGYSDGVSHGMRIMSNSR